VRPALLAVCLFLVACGTTEGVPGVQVRMDFTGATFYDAPVPGDHRRTGDVVSLAGFPDGRIAFVDNMIGLLGAVADGFATQSGIYFALDAPIAGVDLPGVAESVTPASTVFLVDVDPASPEQGTRIPVTVELAPDEDRYGPANLLSVIPLQGVPLRARTRYAAVVLRAVASPPLGVSISMWRLARGERPDGLSNESYESYRLGVEELDRQGVEVTDVAGLAVFTTGDPTAGAKAVLADMLSHPLPSPGAFTLDVVYPDFCQYSSTIRMPIYQGGTPPFDTEGGAWVFDAQGAPVAQGTEEALMIVTIPRREMLPGGFPVVLYSRTGGGGRQPLADRGVHTATVGDIPGTGFARDFAQVGWAGVTVDGPHGGLRNVSSGDEQYLVFNVFNLAALRDNVRQSAVELALQAHVLEVLALDVADCPGVIAADDTAVFDVDHLALFGHSSGAWIGQIAAAIEPRFHALLLSGAGASWIENIMHKKKPQDVKSIAELIVRPFAGELTHKDPVLSFLSWTVEVSDPQVYNREASRATQILMLQGIVDHYIMPPIAGATSLSLGLDLAGPAIDETTPELDPFAPLGTLLPLIGRRKIPLPAAGNRDGTTAVVVQVPEDGIEDGHETVFQTAAPRAQIRCFLESFAMDAPEVCAP
jgi:hypothetical protein